MIEQEIIKQIKQKRDAGELVNQVIKNPKHIEVLIKVIGTEKGSIKFGCEKIVRLVSERKPELVYPYFDFFVKLLDSVNSFLKWGAIITISNLAVVDSENKFEKIFKKYYAPVSGPVMVTAANIIRNSWKIVQAKPELADKIADEILKLEKAKYKYKGELSHECKNVVCGHAIDSFEKFFDKIKDKDGVIRFIKKQLKNTRNSVRKKAKRFMKKCSLDSYTSSLEKEDEKSGK